MFDLKSSVVKREFKAPSFDPYNRYRNSGEGIFGFRKDKNVIIPGVTYYEEDKLKKIQGFVAKETGKECTVPQDLINDVYSMFVNEDVKRRPKDGMNNTRHMVLDKVYDSLTKVLTKDSPLFTQILTRELALVLQKVDDDIKEQQQQQGDNGGQGDDQGLETEGNSKNGEGDEEGGDNSSQGNSKSIEDMVEESLNKMESKIEEAKNNADEKMKNIEKQVGKEAMKDLSKSDPDFLEKIDTIKDTLSKVSFNKNSIKKVLEKILNESMNYFSTKFKRVEESLFECEECEDLIGLEFLHPVFRNSELFNLANESRIYKGKIDLYLDCSGSMESEEVFEGSSISMINLVKGIAITLFRMGMIENLYFFDNFIYKIENVNEITILSFNRSGGTNFNKVIENVNKEGNNAVIITDGYDSCREYSKRAFWIGVGGTTFDNYYTDSFTDYRKNKQCVAYNSRTSKLDYCV